MRANSSLELLAHFDSAALETFDDGIVRYSGPTRGVGWVLRWAAALAVLFVATSILFDFAYCIAAEHALARAARAGVVEATLPRASYQSVCGSIERRLAGYSYSRVPLQISLEQNGVPVRGAFVAQGDDEFAVAVSMPAASVLPKWLRSVRVWRTAPDLIARASEHVPGRAVKWSAH